MKRQPSNAKALREFNRILTADGLLHAVEEMFRKKGDAKMMEAVCALRRTNVRELEKIQDRVYILRSKLARSPRVRAEQARK